MDDIVVTGPVWVRLTLANGQTLEVLAEAATLTFDAGGPRAAPVAEPPRAPALTWVTAPQPEDAIEAGAQLPAAGQSPSSSARRGARVRVGKAWSGIWRGRRGPPPRPPR